MSYRFTAFFVPMLMLSGVVRADGPEDAIQAQARIAAIFAEYDKPDSAGCAVGVIRAGRLTLTRGFGMANLEHAIPNGPSTVYEIGSMSKQFTAASILLLAQRGSLSLDDDVRKFIPELPQYQRPITLRHLLNHTSGLRDYVVLFSLVGKNYEDITTEQDAFDYIVRQEALNFTPGEDALYSNSNYHLLGMVVRRVTGKPITQFAKENIFDPLGMEHTLILDQHRKIVPRRATGYSRNAAGGFQIQMSNYELTGDGAVHTSIEDLAKWDGNFYDPKVGGSAWIEQMYQAGTLDDGLQLQYAAGLFVDTYKGLRRVSHQGSWAGYRADLVRFPDQRLSVACLCNAGALDAFELSMQVASLYLRKEFDAFDRTQGAKASHVPKLDARKARGWVGLYRSITAGDLRRISLVDGKLMIDSMTMSSRELLPLGTDRFGVSGMSAITIRFSSVDGRPRLEDMRDRRKTNVFERMDPFAPAVAELNDFVGRYFSKELNASYEVSLEGGGLQLTYPHGLKRPLLPTYRDSFAVLSGAQLEFARDASGRVSGFGVNAGRTRNVRFAR